MKKIRYVIITDQEGIPMTFVSEDGQLCYSCSRGNPVRVETESKAKTQIRRTIKNRRNWGLEEQEQKYRLLTVDTTTRI